MERDMLFRWEREKALSVRNKTTLTDTTEEVDSNS